MAWDPVVQTKISSCISLILSDPSPIFAFHCQTVTQYMLVNLEVKFARLLPGNAEINCLTCQNLLRSFVKVLSWICQTSWFSLAKLEKYDAGLSLVNILHQCSGYLEWYRGTTA